DLRLKLWPADTFVDFDHGLNSAVARLREALNDSAQGPKYIETVARRGYRFIGELEHSCNTQAETQEVPHPDKPWETDLPQARTGKLANRKRWLPVMAAMGLLAVVSSAYFLRSPSGSKAAGKSIDSVAVLPFENDASSPDTDYLADGITQSAIDHLSRLGNLKVISLGSVLR